MPSTIPSSTVPCLSAMDRLLGYVPFLCRLGRCGCWAIRIRPCRGTTRPSPWPTSWRITTVWRSRSVLGCLSSMLRRERHATQEQAEAAMALLDRAGVCSSEWRGDDSCGAGRWPSRDRAEEGIAQMRQGMAACRATGAEIVTSRYFADACTWPRHMEKWGKRGKG